MAGIKENSVTLSKSGSIASFKTSTPTPIKSLKVHFSPQQVSGTPSPSSPIPISIWSSLNIHRDGKNLWNNGDIIYGTWTSGSGVADEAPRGCRTQDISVNSGESYTLYYNGSQPYSASIIELDAKKGFIKRDHYQWNESPYPIPITVTTTANTKYIYAQVYKNYDGAITYDILSTFDMQLELGSEQTEFEPYNGRQINVSWSELGSFYGGYADVISGELVLNHYGGSLAYNGWKYNSKSGYFALSALSQTIKIPSSESIVGDIICSHYKPVAMDNFYDADYQIAISSTGWIFIRDTRYTNVNAFKQHLIDDNVTFAYEGNATQTFTFTPISPLKTLTGRNNIWSDANGNVEVEYYLTESVEDYKKKFYMSTPHLETFTGDIAHFNTDVIAPLNSLKIHFNPQQLLGTPSPTNICSIYGWSGIPFYKHGKNILYINESRIFYKGNSDNFTYSLSDGEINGSVTTSGNNDLIFAMLYIKSDMVGTQFSISAEGQGYSTTIMHCNARGTSRSTISDGIIKSTDVGYYLAARFRFSTVGTFSVRNIKVQIGSATTEYEPIKGHAGNINFNDTYYGGWINEKGQVWINTIGKKIKDFNWNYNSSLTRFATSRDYGESPLNKIIQCEVYETVSPTGSESHHENENNVIYAYGVSSGDKYWTIHIRDSRYTTTTELINGVGENLICYNIDTPILASTVSLGSLKTFRGINNIWSNANGNIELSYWKH